MPKSRMAWSCWNYLAYTNTYLNGNGRSGSETESESGLYSKEEEFQREKSLNTDVNQVSLFVLFFFLFFGCVF